MVEQQIEDLHSHGRLGEIGRRVRWCEDPTSEEFKLKQRVKMESGKEEQQQE